MAKSTKKVILKMKKLYDDSILPKKAHDTEDAVDACWDVYCRIPEGEITIKPHEVVKLSTGFAALVPKGYFGTFIPRSGMATKFQLRPANTPSCIDYGYTGEWFCAIENFGNEDRVIKNGERICQMAILPIPDIVVEVTEEDFEETARGATGFGDSGKF